MALQLTDAITKFKDKPPTEPPKKCTSNRKEPGKGKAVLGVQHNLCAFCDEDSFRYSLSQILIDPDEKLVVATNAKVLAMVPINSVEADKAFLVDGKALSNVFGIRRKIGDKIHSHVNVLSEGEQVEISTETKHGKLALDHSHVDMHYPRYKDVVPTGEPKFDVSLSATELIKICKHAISIFDDEPNVRLEFRFTDPGSAALIQLRKPEGKKSDTPVATYVLMPLSDLED